MKNARPAVLAGRALSPWVAAAHAPFLAALALLVTVQVIAARDRRNAIVAASAVALAGAALCVSVSMALAVLLGLVMVLGGRIAPSLTATHLGLPGKAMLFNERPWFERAAALAAAFALTGWLAAPASGATAAASLLAAVMSSMIRKHAGNAFARSAGVTACYTLTGLAVVLRAGAEAAGEDGGLLLLGAACAWSAAAVLFLAAFGRVLVSGLVSGRPAKEKTPTG